MINMISRWFAEDDDEEKEDVNLAKKPFGARVDSLGVDLRFYPDLIEGQHIKASLSSAGRWGFTTRFMYDAVVTRCQEMTNCCSYTYLVISIDILSNKIHLFRMRHLM